MSVEWDEEKTVALAEKVNQLIQQHCAENHGRGHPACVEILMALACGASGILGAHRDDVLLMAQFFNLCLPKGDPTIPTHH